MGETLGELSRNVDVNFSSLFSIIVFVFCQFFIFQWGRGGALPLLTDAHRYIVHAFEQ